MEYKMFRAIREKVRIPFFIRFILCSLLITISIIPIALPLFPGSLFLGMFFLIIGIILIVPGGKIRHVIKIRKGIIYLTKNLHKRKILKHKIRDIKYHIFDILKDKK